MSRVVHFDVDPGCDDAVMLALALGHEAIDVVGLSTVAGNSTIENTTRNALAILELADRGSVPVARGCGRPLVGDLTTAEWVHGERGIRGDLPASIPDPIETHGAEYLVEQARTYGEDLTVAAVGPQTNLAVALAIEPDLPELVGDIYLMGGAALTVGNTTPMAEANVYNDAEAASRVVQDAHPWLVGLDATNDATVPRSAIDDYRERGSRFEVIADWLTYPEEVMAFGAGDDPAVHDAAVAAHLIDDAVLTFETYPVSIDTTGGPSHGAVVCDYHGVTGADPNCEVAVGLAVDRYREVLYEGLEAFVAS